MGGGVEEVEESDQTRVAGGLHCGGLGWEKKKKQNKRREKMKEIKEVKVTLVWVKA